MSCPRSAKTSSINRIACLQCLSGLRAEIGKELGIPEDEIELSMGMSGDFEQAVGTQTPLIVRKLRIVVRAL